MWRIVVLLSMMFGALIPNLQGGRSGTVAPNGDEGRLLLQSRDYWNCKEVPESEDCRQNPLVGHPFGSPERDAGR